MILSMRLQLIRSSRLCSAESFAAAKRRQHLSTSATLQVSLNSAINRGIRKSKQDFSPRRSNDRPKEWNPADTRSRDYDSHSSRPRGKYSDNQRYPQRRDYDSADAPKRWRDSAVGRRGDDRSQFRDREQFTDRRDSRYPSESRYARSSERPRQSSELRESRYPRESRYIKESEGFGESREFPEPRDAEDSGGARRFKEKRQYKNFGDRNDRRNAKLSQSAMPDTEEIATPKPTAQSKAPLFVPYTTSASQFVYGTSSVSAALKSKRRKFYVLYMYTGEDGQQPVDKKIERLARNAGVMIRHVSGDWIRTMDKMSHGRPHNNYILEASAIPQLPVGSLTTASPIGETFNAMLRYQSQEEAAVNGTNGEIHYDSRGQRYPLVLMLHEVLDPGNLGAIVRSAYFFGVDAVIIGTRTCASLTPVAQKSSAGAAEYIPILNIEDPRAFLTESQENGWRVCAAVAPPASPSRGPSSSVNSAATKPETPETISPASPAPSSSTASKSKHTSPAALPSLLSQHPTILLVGNEGLGLPRYLVARASHHVSIPGVRAGKGGVDSLNVSVAAALLCNSFMNPGAATPAVAGIAADTSTSAPAGTPATGDAPVDAPVDTPHTASAASLAAKEGAADKVTGAGAAASTIVSETATAAATATQPPTGAAEPDSAAGNEAIEVAATESFSAIEGVTADTTGSAETTKVPADSNGNDQKPGPEEKKAENDAEKLF